MNQDDNIPTKEEFTEGGVVDDTKKQSKKDKKHKDKKRDKK